MSKSGDWDYYTLLHRTLYWPLALGTATKILVQIEEMAADKSILSTVYAKRGARQSPEAYI
jgi:hypothetical protein